MNKIIFKQLRKRETFSLQADGDSMLPLLHPKDQVYYKKISFFQTKTNDLILIFKKNQAFTHRVIYKTSKYLVTKGDNNFESDGKIYPQQIIGKVTSVKRRNNIFDPEMIYLIQSSLYFKEIVKIVHIFKKNKINYVFLKGLPIHLYYEKTHPRRIYQDADILIDKNDFKKIKKILIRFGYRSIDNSLSPVQKKFRDKISEISFYKSINHFQVVFDIHLEAIYMVAQLGRLEALYPQRLIDQISEDFLREKINVNINGFDFYLLSPINLIVFLSFHYFHHNFHGPFRLELLDKVIRRTLSSRYRSVKKLILKSTNKYRLQNFVFPVFSLLNKYYNTPIIKQWNNAVMKQFLKINIFDDENRLSNGISRFFYVFLLSPQPFYKKIFIFIYPKVIYIIIFSLNLKIKNLLKNIKNQSTLIL